MTFEELIDLLLSRGFQRVYIEKGVTRKLGTPNGFFHLRAFPNRRGEIVELKRIYSIELSVSQSFEREHFVDDASRIVP